MHKLQLIPSVHFSRADNAGSGDLFIATTAARHVVLRRCVGKFALASLLVTTVHVARADQGDLQSVDKRSAAHLKSATQKPTTSSRQPDSKSEDILVSAAADGAAGRIWTPKHSTIQVSTVSAADLKATGKPNVIAALEQVSPYISASPYAGAGGNGFAMTMQLRNLSADQTLILVNGQRRHLSANFNVNAGPSEGTNPADISLIPLDSIDHVEIIGDGASALYGQEAIAGAVNIVLKSGTEANTLSATEGGYYPGDGMNSTVSGNYGFAVGHTGATFDLSGQVTRQQLAVRTGNYIGQTFFPVNGHPDPRAATVGRDLNRNPTLPSYTLASFAENGTIPLASNITTYSTATYAHRTGLNTLTTRPQSNDTVVRALYPIGFVPFEAVTENDFQVNTGIRGQSFRGWSWDTYVLYGRDENQYSTDNSDNATYGLNSQTNFYAGKTIVSTLTAGAKASRTFGSGFLAKPASITVGFEQRHDTFQAGAGDQQSWGDGGVHILDGPNAGKAAAAGVSGHRGISPDETGQYQRDVSDGSVNLKIYATPKWEWTLGGHVVNYSHLATVETGSIGTRYAFNPRWAVRANISNGYRPPTLEQMNYYSIIPSAAYSTAGIPPTSAAGRALGGVPLKGEYSRNYSVGLDATPFRNFHLTANLYRIAINDRLYDSAQFGGIAAVSLLEGIGITGIEYAHYYSNAVNTETSGGDVEADYTSHFGPRFGSVRWTAAVNIADTEITHTRKTPSQLAALGYTYFDEYARMNLLHSNPKNKIILGADWNIGRYSVSLQEIRYGSVIFMGYPSETSANWTTIKPSYLTNLRVGVNITSKLNISIGANNLFNHYPNRNSAATVTQSSGAIIYPTNSPYGFFGGYYYASASLKF